MTRPLLLLLLALAAVTALIGVPVVLIAGDDEPAHKAAHHTARDDDDANSANKKANGGGMFDWLRALAMAEGVPANAGVDDDDDAHVGPQLAAFDGAVATAVERCAPEIMGYDRGFLLKLQPDWHVLKPNLRPAWRAWQKMPGVVVDEERIADCEKAFAHEADCAVVAQRFELCTKPFRGTLGEGAACEAGDQCASSACEDHVCTRPNDCNKPSDCPSGMTCGSDPVQGINTCLELPKEGDPCIAGVFDERAPTADTRCGGGLVCDEEERCFPGRREGARCGPGQPCAMPFVCATDEDGDRVCTKDEPDQMPPGSEEDDAVAVAADGAADDDASCACDPLRDGKACVNGRCVPAQIVEVGDACDDAHVCRDSLGINACIDGVCKAAKGTGDACTSHDECKDDYVCNNGACTPPGRPGEPCSDNDDCIYGLECAGDPSTQFATSICGLAVEAPSYNEGDGRADDRIRAPIALDDVVIRGDVDSDGSADSSAVPDTPDENPESPPQIDNEELQPSTDAILELLRQRPLDAPADVSE